MKTTCTCIETSPAKGRPALSGNLFTRSVLVMMMVLAAVMPRVSGQTFTAGNLAVLVDATANSTNTSGSIYELNATTANQSSPVNSLVIPNTLRFVTDKPTPNQISLSNDGSLLVISGWYNPGSTTNNLEATSAPIYNSRAVGTISNSFSFSTPVTYTEITAGKTSRSAATVDNTNYIIADNTGIYLNSSNVNITNSIASKAFVTLQMLTLQTPLRPKHLAEIFTWFKVQQPILQ